MKGNQIKIITKDGKEHIMGGGLMDGYETAQFFLNHGFVITGLIAYRPHDIKSIIFEEDK